MGEHIRVAQRSFEMERSRQKKANSTVNSSGMMADNVFSRVHIPLRAIMTFSTTIKITRKLAFEDPRKRSDLSRPTHSSQLR